MPVNSAVDGVDPADLTDDESARIKQDGLRPQGSQVEQQDEGGHGQDPAQCGQSDLHPAPWPLPLNLSGAGVHQKAERALPETVGADPDGEQDVLEGEVVVARAHGVDLLAVAADLGPERCPEMRLQQRIRPREPAS